MRERRSDKPTGRRERSFSSSQLCSPPCRLAEPVDGRVKPGHDGFRCRFTRPPHRSWTVLSRSAKDSHKAIHAIVSLRARERLKPSQSRDKVAQRERGGELGVRCGEGWLSVRTSAQLHVWGKLMSHWKSFGLAIFAAVCLWAKPLGSRASAQHTAPPSGATAASSTWEACRAPPTVARLAINNVGQVVGVSRRR